MELYYRPNLEQGLPVTKNPNNPPNNIELYASLVNDHAQVLHSTKWKYKNPASNPAVTPIKGFQKYHDVKNSLTLFGLGVTLQLLSIDLF